MVYLKSSFVNKKIRRRNCFECPSFLENSYSDNYLSRLSEHEKDMKTAQKPIRQIAYGIPVFQIGQSKIDPEMNIGNVDYNAPESKLRNHER